MIELSHATLPQLAAELRRQAEWHDGTVELTSEDSIAEALRRVAGRLEAMGE